MEKLHKQYRICQEHFEESQFMNPVVRNRLIHTAVPIVIAVPNPPALLTPKRQLPKRISPPWPQTHLLKNVRNNLKKADLQVGDNMVSWQRIVDFHNFDKIQMIQMAPKLKDKHIELPPFASM